MMYLLDIDVTWDDTVNTTYRVNWEADTPADLKNQFTKFILKKAYDNKASAFTGTVHVKRVNIVDLGDKSFTGSFILTEEVNVEFT